MNSVSTATKLVPLCSAQKRASAAVSVISVINCVVYRSRKTATTPVLCMGCGLTSAALPCRVLLFECSFGSPPDARLSDPYLRSAPPCRCGSASPPIGMGASQTRPRPTPVYRSAGSLRHYPMHDRCVLTVVPGRRCAPSRKCGDGDWSDHRALGRHGQPELGNRRGGIGHRRT